MERLYTVAETVRLAGWGDGNSQGPARQLYMRAYARAYRACGLGHAPGVRRTGRGFILTRQQADVLVQHLRRRWPEMAAQASPALAG